MKSLPARAGLLAVGLWLLAGCTTYVQVQDQFPDMVAQPRELIATLVLDNEFRHYQAQPTKDDRIELGPLRPRACAEMLAEALRRLPEETQALAACVERKTGSYPLQIQQFIELMHAPPTGPGRPRERGVVAGPQTTRQSLRGAATACVRGRQAVTERS